MSRKNNNLECINNGASKNNLEKSYFIPLSQPYNPDQIYNSENFSIFNDKKLGDGTYSTVYLCRNNINNKYYACKVISKKKLRKFGNDLTKNEIEIQERIENSNIIKLYSHEEDDDNYYLFLEYSNGKTLSQLLKNKVGKGKVKLTELQAYILFKQICESVRFLHNNKIIHRDLRLENIMVNEANDNNNKNNNLLDSLGNKPNKNNINNINSITNDSSKLNTDKDFSSYVLKLFDFSYATTLTEETPFRKSICGTAEYMSPELINEKAYNYCIDIWSLGIIFYYLLHGELPFGNIKETDKGAIFNKIITSRYDIDSNLSPNCKNLIKRMLCSNMEGRITIEEIMEHPWMKEWDNDLGKENKNQEEDTAEVNNILQKMGINPQAQDKDAYFYDVFNQLEKKNQLKGKKKKRGKSSSVVYKKNGLVESNTKLKKELSNIKGCDLSGIDIVNKTKKKSAILKEDDLLKFNIKKNIKPDIKVIDNNDHNEEDIKVINNENEIIIDKASIIKKDDDSGEEKLVSMIPDKPKKLKEIRINKKKLEDNMDINTNKSKSNYSSNPKQNNKYSVSKMESNTKTFYNNNFNNNNNYNNINGFNMDKDILNAIDLFEKAKNLKDENQNKKVVKKEEGFFARLFKPFKCGECI